MELIDIVPDFNLYEEYWKIYTHTLTLPPMYASEDSVIEKAIVGECSGIYGRVYNSVIGCNVTVGRNTEIRDSIIMNDVVIGDNCRINKSIIAEGAVLGSGIFTGAGDEVPNETDPHIYTNGLVTIGEGSVVPDNVTIGKNCMINGETLLKHYPNNILQSGKTLNKAGGLE